MSDMLEQAIIDASALKEAATKNAETLVLEKYSNEIKKAVETLLEQDDLAASLDMPADPKAAAPGADPAAPPAPATEPAKLSSVMEHIPLAVTSENSDEVEIPLDQLFEEITKLSETMRFGGNEIFDESLYEETDALEEDLLEEEYFEEGYGLEEEEFEEGYGMEEDLLEEEEFEEGYGMEEDVYEGVLDELYLEEADVPLEEAMIVDTKMHTVPRGWAGLPEGELRLAEEEILALEQDSKYREAQEAKRKAVRELNAVNETVTKQNEKLVKALNKSSKYMTKLRNAVLTLEEKLDNSSLVNAKLLYQNKALNSDSMNERQKHKLVEAVSNAETIEEAKVIFETLQNTVGSTSRKSQPNSLSEAVQRSSSVILSARKENSSEQKTDPTLNRWKFLAGIDK